MKTPPDQASRAETRAFPENHGNALVWLVLAVHLLDEMPIGGHRRSGYAGG